MKKIFSIIVVLLLFGLQGFAQQYINLYQDDVVIKQYSTEEIDSMSITETEPRIVSFWRDGDAFQTYNAADIDSIKVSNRGGAPFAYIGIVGFNGQLNTSDIGILSPATASQYKTFVNNLPRENGTILYYAVDNALDMLENANIESPLKSVNVITFTDGLDQGSLMLTDKYSSSADYLNALGERIATTRIEDLPVNSYSVGLRGSDVSNVTLFKQNLQRLASSEEKAFEVSSISDLRYKFQDIANQIISVSTRQTMSVRVPGPDNGTRMRFVFDGKSAANSELYIEGTFDLQDRSLHDVTYQGIKATSGKTVQGTQEGVFVTFTFTGMRREAGTSLIPTSSVKHYYMYPSSTSWQANSEFTPTGNTQRNVSHSGTSIMLVLDCSSSLGSDFSRMQQYANEFIDLIASNAEPFELLTPKNVKAQLDEDELVVNVSWDEVKYARTYNIYRNSSSSGTYQLVAEGVTTNSWTDESPLKGYNYYKVCAVNRNKVTSQSSYASANVVLDTPTNVRTELTAKNEKLVINVTWNGVKYAQNYKVYRSSSYNGTYELVADHLTSTSWTDESPVNDNNYYKVSATSHGIESSRSDYSYISYKLNAPTNIKAQLDDNALVVNVSWDAVQGAQNYNVYRSNSDTGIYTMVAEGVTSTSWTDNNPMQGSNCYKVCAVGYGFTSAQSSYASVNISLAAPTNVKAEIDPNDLVVNISWTAVKYGQNYKIFRSNTSNGTYELIAENVTSSSWTDNNPMKGSNYYKVCAVGYGFTSAQSSYASVNVSLATPTNVKAGVAVLDEKFVVNVFWDAVNYAQSYDIYRSSSSTGTYDLVAENITSTIWTDLTTLYGNSYYYKVCAKNRNVVSSQSSNAFVMVELDAPISITAAVDENDLVVNVSWTGVEFARNYNVYRSSNPSSNYALVAENVTSTTWVDTTPLQGESYYMVSAVNSNNVSSFSAYTSVTVQLDAPASVKAEVDADDLVVNVAWDGVKYAQSYQVYRSNSSSGDYALVAENVTTTSWVDTNPLQGENYYKVSAVNRNIVSPQSASTLATVQLESPINLKTEISVRDNNFVVNLSWEAVKFAHSYNVYRSNSSNGYYELVADHITTNAWTDSTPVYGNSYYYKVCAINRNVNSPQSAYMPATVQLEAPENVKALLDDNNLVVNLSWDAIKNAQSYNIYRSNSASDSYTLVAERVTTPMWTDESPVEGNNYYKVCAVGYGYTSAQSVNVSVIVKLDIPKNVKAEMAVDDLVVNVSWEAVKYAQSYQVYRSNSSSGDYALVAENVTSTSWVDTNPLQGENYYKVCTVNSNIVSSQSAYASATVQLEAPANIKSETNVQDEKFVINVSWDAVKYAQSYDVYRSSTSEGSYELVADNIVANVWTDLTPLYGNSYYYKICAKNRNVTSPQSSFTAVTVQFDVPANVKSEMSIKDDKFVINVSWDAVKLAQSYNIYRSSIDSDSYTLIAEGVIANTWIDENPLEGDNYYKICAAGYGYVGNQSSYSYYNLDFKLDTPVNVKAETDATSYAVNVSWDAVQNAQSYNVYRNSNTYGKYELIAENVTSTSWTDTNPLQGDNYYVVSASGYGFTSTQSSYAYVNITWYRTATFTYDNWYKVGNITLSLPTNNTKGFRLNDGLGLNATGSGGTFNLIADDGFLIKRIVMTKNTNQKRFNNTSNAPEGTVITEVGGATSMDNMLAIWSLPTGLKEVTVKNNGGAVTLTQIEVMYIPTAVQTP